MTHRILILGGTIEARQLARHLATRPDFDVTLSLAGRTRSPAAQAVAVRSGGFGGAKGLADYLVAQRIGLLVDATHPHAARISANAAQAAAATGVEVVALRRPAWMPSPGDRWVPVDSPEQAVHALGTRVRRVFLALGRQEVSAFDAAPRNFYLVRSIDPVEPPLAASDAVYVLARGPFREADERELLGRHRIDAIVCKNSGGAAAAAKLAAARDLGIEVFMINRPPLPEMPGAEDVEGLLAMIDHRLAPDTKRGV